MRDWREAHEKVEREGRCRVSAQHGPPEPHHLVARSKHSSALADHPNNIVPLCRTCHEATHHGRLDLLPYLTVVEQSMAVVLCEGLLDAIQAITHQHWSPRAVQE